MKLLHYGTDQDYLMISQIMEQLSLAADPKKGSCHLTDYEEFQCALTDRYYNIVIVTSDNAMGMEGVIAVRNSRPELPVIWLSNDRGFGLQSYRLGCTYFGIKPITKEKLKQALTRCKAQMSMS